MRILLTLSLVLLGYQARANYVSVSRDAVIRKEALSSSQVIERVKAGTFLPLLDENLFGTGYLKVRTPSGKTGFIYKSRVRVRVGEMPTSDEANTVATNVSGGNLEVHIINVGQGDGMIIRCPDGNHEILIDAAELNSSFRYPNSLNEFKNYISAYQSKDNPIEVVVATHPHSDHIAGMKWILTQYDVKQYVDNGMTNTSGTYSSLESKIKELKVNRSQLNEADVPKIDFCPREDVSAQILRPAGFDEPGIDPNNYSVIVRIDYGSTSFLFTGDAEKEMEDKLMADNNTSKLLDVDFLKVGHHGSHSSSQKTFLDVVTPEIAAISSGAETVGTNKSHKHPRMISVQNLLPYLRERRGVETTLEAYNKSTRKWEQVSTKAALYITNNDGDLVFLSDGSKIWRRGDK